LRFDEKNTQWEIRIFTKGRFYEANSCGVQFALFIMNFQGIGLSRGQMSIWPLTFKKRKGLKGLHQIC